MVGGGRLVVADSLDLAEGGRLVADLVPELDEHTHVFVIPGRSHRINVLILVPPSTTSSSGAWWRWQWRWRRFENEIGRAHV